MSDSEFVIPNDETVSSDDIHPGADLAGADLSKALLVGANLEGATLAGADLSRASLRDATLDGALCAAADVTDAALSGANVADAALLHVP